jgi:hypothetical protein
MVAMARIRTVKPEFFTSESVCAVSPLARLLFIGLWCESDRDGRLKWKPQTIKIRYLPVDDCDILELSQELVTEKMISVYEVDGIKYCEIPAFKTHQVINNRERESEIPAPKKDASPRVKAEGRKEGKGKEGRERKEQDQSEIDMLFDSFWMAGMYKTGKKDAEKVFKKLISGRRQKQEFTEYLIKDIQWRLANQQLGFDKMHPTTYLRNERWTDERRTEQPNQRKGQLSLAERTDKQTEILHAKLAAGDFGQCPLGQDEPALQAQVGFSGGGEVEPERSIDGELYQVVPENRGVN